MKTEMILPEISIQSQFGPFWLFSVAIVLVGFSIWTYRWTKPPIPSYQRFILIGLRSISLISVWFLLSQFVLNWSIERIKPHRIAILVDDSQSMGITDRLSDRGSQVDETLNQLKQNKSKYNNDFQFFTFGSVFKEGNKYSFQQPASNFEDAFFKIFNRIQKKPDDIILITDGNINSGSSPIGIIKKGFTPVHCIAIGDSSFENDISIPSILHPIKSYVHDQINVSTTIQGTGVEGLESTVLLRDESGNEIARKNVNFKGSNYSDQSLEFSITPTQAGKRSWNVSVESGDGEENTNNNSRSFVVDVLERRKNILLFSPEPNADASAFASSLEDIDDYDSKILIGGGKKDMLLRGAWSDTSAGYDAVILFLQGRWNAKSKTWLARISSESIPMFIIAGEIVDSGIRSTIAQNLGSLRSNRITGEYEISPSTSHPVFTDENRWISESNRSMPPLNLSNTLSHDGEVLAYAQEGNNRIPVLTVLQENPRILYFGASGIWRWKVFAHSQIDHAREFDKLVSRLFRWVTTQAENERVFVAASKDLYSGTENAEVIVNVYDESLVALENVIVSAEVKHDDEIYTYELNPTGDGGFSIQFSTWGSGPYSVTANIRNDTEILTRTTEFYVDEFSIELSDTRMRPDIIREIADVSGGGVYYPGEESGLLERIKPSEDLEVVSGSWRPFGLSLTLLIIITTLGIEWLFRIRRGMV